MAGVRICWDIQKPNEFSQGAVQRGNEHATKNAPPSKRTRCFHYFDNFLQKSSLHGMKYLRRGTVMEKRFWTLSYSAIFFGLIGMVYYIQWNYPDAVHITAFNTHREIWNVPFPAVTICTENRIDRSRWDEHLKSKPHYEGLSEDDIPVLFELTAMLMTKSNIINSVKSLDPDFKDDLEQIYDSYSSQVILEMEKLMPQVNETFVQCLWLGVLSDCNKMFSLAPTDMGYCFSFNRRGFVLPEPKRNVSVLRNFLNQSGKKLWHVGSAGSAFGVTTVLRVPSGDSGAFNSENFHGFKVLIHNPYTFPLVLERGIPVPAGKYVLCSMSALQTFPVEDIERMPYPQRQCALEDDVKLTFHKKYTFDNCIFECRIREMNRICGCVPYQLNFARNTYGMCTFQQILCITAHESNFTTLTPTDNLDDYNISASGMKCECPVYCKTTKYAHEVSSADFVGQLEGKHYDYRNGNVSDDTNRLDYVRLRIFFKDFSYISYKRDLRYTWNNVIADFGGIASLFIGFSTICLVEIFYHLVVVPMSKAAHSFRENDLHIHPVKIGYLP